MFNKAVDWNYNFQCITDYSCSYTNCFVIFNRKPKKGGQQKKRERESKILREAGASCKSITHFYPRSTQIQSLGLAPAARPKTPELAPVDVENVVPLPPPTAGAVIELTTATQESQPAEVQSETIYPQLPQSSLNSKRCEKEWNTTKFNNY
jgi:hypothetical protein